jgi:hypothetical protein
MSKKLLLYAFPFIFIIVFLTSCDNAFNSLSQEIPLGSKNEEELVEGELITTGKNEFVIRQMDGTDLKLKITDKTIYWDGNAWMGNLPIYTGDTITAFGKWNASGTDFQVDRYYTNLLNLSGIVEYVSGESESFQLNDQYDQYFIFPLLYRSEIVYERNENDPDIYYDLLPRPGDYVEVVGRKIKGSDVLAVTITHKK